MTTKTSTDRLKRLIKVAEQFKAEPLRLDMGRFVAGFYKMEFSIEQAIQSDNCGTVCCLAGRAGLDPTFRSEGLVTNLTSDETEILGRTLHANSASVLADFFGISVSEADEVFYGENEYSSIDEDEDGDMAVDKVATLDRIIGSIQQILLSREA